MEKRARLSALLLGLILLAVVLAPGTPAPKASEDGHKLDAAWWARAEPFLRRVLNLPRAVQLELKDIAPAGAPQFRIVVLEMRQGEQAKPFFFYASADGTKILVEDVYDLTRDPFARYRERIRLESAPSLGPPTAPVTIVEYSDYTCPFCQRFFLTLEKPLLKRYGEQLRYIYKHYPLPGLRAWSRDAALAAACAFRQSNEAFWLLHEQLFIHMGRLNEKNIFLTLARGLPLDGAKFQTCLERREAEADVDRDVAEAESLGVNGTPTFFINGRPVFGLLPAERFWDILDEELALATRK